MKVRERIGVLEGRLIVSCQAGDGDPFRSPDLMARFALAAVEGGAAGIRANGSIDVAAIRQTVTVPIIGIHKQRMPDGRVLITPSMEAIEELIDAGADMIALDCTARGQRLGALERIAKTKERYGVPVLADIATTGEAQTAAAAGADAVLSTLHGYTENTAASKAFEPSFIRELVNAVRVPVIAEGRIHSPRQAKEAVAAGSFAVIVGTAITRPRETTRSFVDAVHKAVASQSATIVAIDLGATNTKFGVVSSNGRISSEGYVATPTMNGRETLLEHLKKTAEKVLEGAAEGPAPGGIGIATAGWIDFKRGSVAYATDNLPGWTGTPIAAELKAELGLPVWVENDANALAVAEKRFGAAKTLDHFVCITLGTGVGGGCYINGQLNRGAHYFANAIGHMSIDAQGPECNCGQRGCLETYASAKALLSYAHGEFETAEALILAANHGNSNALNAVAVLASYLARGCAILVQLLDPEAIILAGGLAQKNQMLINVLRDELSQLVSVCEARRLSIMASRLGYYGGVLGAAAIALEGGQ
jgi:glucokinase-like ROK family protein